MEDLIHYLEQLNPFLVYAFSCLVAFTENIFPPFPSDVALVAVGSLSGVGSVDYFGALVSSSVGSTLGFVTMFKVGDWFGHKILERGRIKFLPLDQLHKVEGWFHRYGYWVVIANRFLSGTRAVVSVFAGMSELSLWWCTTLSFLSALVWNGILLYAGRTLGANWKDISIFLDAYGKAATSILAIVILVLVARYIYRKQSKSGDIHPLPPDSPNE